MQRLLQLSVERNSLKLDFGWRDILFNTYIQLIAPLKKVIYIYFKRFFLNLASLCESRQYDQLNRTLPHISPHGLLGRILKFIINYKSLKYSKNASE